MNDDADSFSHLFLGWIHEKETAMVEVRYAEGPIYGS